ncbi:heavy-metal-associated domain-containing protein [Algisphaera agarilytica]|nr:heavy-metal-associated domain-containing protein [Algisphaera agarilytica]
MCLSLLVGCASTPDSASEGVTKPACSNCAAGTECKNCDAKSASEACTVCVASEGKTSCESCAAGKDCASCDAKKKGEHACATCAAGEACTKCTAKQSEAAPAELTMSERVATIDAKGMSCPLCASNIDRRMQKLDGVSWTKIDLGKGQVIVGLEDDTPAPSADELFQAVNDAGYTAGEVTLPEEVVTP